VGRIYQQTFIDTYSKIGFAKLYDRKMPVTAADLLNDRVLPFFARHPQTNGICERFHKTMLNEFSRVAFRKKIYRTVAELQTDLDSWIAEYNAQRPHQGRWCYGKTPMRTLVDSVPLAKEKMLAA
jgi:transposase InsO family protein